MNIVATLVAATIVAACCTVAIRMLDRVDKKSPWTAMNDGTGLAIVVLFTVPPFAAILLVFGGFHAMGWL